MPHQLSYQLILMFVLVRISNPYDPHLISETHEKKKKERKSSTLMTRAILQCVPVTCLDRVDMMQMMIKNGIYILSRAEIPSNSMALSESIDSLGNKCNYLVYNQTG